MEGGEAIKVINKKALKKRIEKVESILVKKGKMLKTVFLGLLPSQATYTKVMNGFEGDLTMNTVKKLNVKLKALEKKAGLK